MALLNELDDLKRKVDFNTYDISVKELMSMVGEGIIDIAPEYQRHFRWKEDRQSQLVESIFLGIPIPSLYMATNADGTWELIDGVQRLSSIIHYAGDEAPREKTKQNTALKLEALEKLQSFNGLAFDDLPKSIQLDFLLKPLKITTLSDKSDKDVRFDLFERLNTGGVVLTNQEIRSCVYRGKFNDFLKELAINEDFTKVVRLSKGQQSDGTADEFVLKFFAFFANYKKFDHSVVDFLNSYMATASKRFNYSEGEKIFKQTFSALKGLPQGITRNRTTTPTNLYEAVAVGAALALEEVGKIETRNIEWMGGDELKILTTGATNSQAKVSQRIEYAKNKFIG